jgi:hypothetical protein
VLSEEKGKGNMKKTAKGIEKSKKYGIIAMEHYGTLWNPSSFSSAAPDRL